MMMMIQFVHKKPVSWRYDTSTHLGFLIATFFFQSGGFHGQSRKEENERFVGFWNIFETQTERK